MIIYSLNYPLRDDRMATNLENMANLENSGNLNLIINSGKLEFFVKRALENSGEMENMSHDRQ